MRGFGAWPLQWLVDAALEAQKARKKFKQHQSRGLDHDDESLENAVRIGLEHQPIHERVAIIDRAAEIMTERREQLIRTAAAEGGKPWSDSAVEVDRAIDGMRLCSECIRTEQGDVVPMGTTAAGANRAASSDTAGDSQPSTGSRRRHTSGVGRGARR